MNQKQKNGFTLIELLVAIVIILVLIGILIPTIVTVQQQARAAETRSVMNLITGATERYYNDFKAYPGPITNADVDDGANPTLMNSGGGISSSENLVLGLMGGLYYDQTSLRITFDSSRVGNGPFSLNGFGVQKRYNPYVSFSGDRLSPGPSVFPGATDNANYPEFADTIGSNSSGNNLDVGNPIVYMRAQINVPNTMNTIGAWDPLDPQYAYKRESIVTYAGATPGDTSRFADWSNYFKRDDEVIGKDRYILFSAGSDEKFGTKDDIIAGN